MKKWYKLIGIVFFIIVCTGFNFKVVSAEDKGEVRSVWVTTARNTDWPSKQGLSIAGQKSEMINNLDYIKMMNLNTVYFQVRSFGDAMYNSKIVPWSSFLTGELGKNPGYDPLQFAVEEAHKRNIEFHAWFNPFRIGQGSNFNLNGYLAKLPADNQLKKNPQWIVSYKDYYCINPGVPEARSYVNDVVMEVVKNYDIDGVQLDDYFYPYGMNENEVQFNDNSEYQKYGSGFANKGDWRRNNINEFIRVLNLKIKSEKAYVKFGVSPFGIWKNGVNNGGSDTSGLSSYDNLFADSLKWVDKGWVDYIAPQIYWNIGFKNAAYEKLLKWWSDNLKNKNVDLIIGQAIYKVGDSSSGTGWLNPNEIINQIKLNRSYSDVNGCAFFNLSSLKANKLGVSDLIKKNVFQYPSQTSSNKIGVAYSTHIQNIGWTNNSVNSYISGTTGQALRLEAIKINLQNQPSNLKVKYRAYIENSGWQDWVNDGQVSGTVGKALRLEALQINLEGADSNKYSIEYQVHVQDVGWMPWVGNGQTAGYTGKGKRVEAVRIRINKNPVPVISYQTHVQNIGWMNPVCNEEISGTVGMAKRAEAIRIEIKNSKQDLKVKYRAYVENSGWQSWVNSGEIAGTVGKALRLEALQVKLEGTDSNKYSIEYQVHVQDIGWMSWVKDGQTAGCEGKGKRVEAVRISIKENSAPVISYQTHVQDIGWMKFVCNGEVSGTVGMAKRAEAIRIEIENNKQDLKVKYRVYVENSGWQSWVNSGEIAGTVGKALRLEALQIKLEGTDSNKYSIEYQVHVQDIGWMSWVKDGEIAGAVGKGKRIEAIKIKLVKV